MLRRGGVIHPKFTTHVRPTVNSAMLVEVEIYRPRGVRPNWTPGVGMNNPYELVWRGKARIQPNLDWRARPRNFAGEYDATQAVRIKVGIDQNELGPDVPFYKNYQVRVSSTPISGTLELVGQIYTVRNALQSDTGWDHDLLCDAGANEVA